MRTAIIRYARRAVGLMVFEEIFRSPDIHSCHSLLRRVRCRHAGPCTCASRSGRPARTGAITLSRPLYANGRRHSCASRPAHRPPSRLVHACCVRAIRKLSLADGIAGTPRASQASPSGTDAGARPRVSLTVVTPKRRPPRWSILSAVTAAVRTDSDALDPGRHPQPVGVGARHRAARDRPHPGSVDPLLAARPSAWAQP